MKRRPQGLAPPAWVRLPEGTACFVGEDAARKAHIEGLLRATFQSWGYGEAVTPTFDYSDQLAVGLGPELRDTMLRLSDGGPAGLALRVDLTTPVARLVATRLREAPRPIRLFYVESVFRRQEAHRGRRREYYQAGVEHFGGAGVESDAEVLLVAAEALRSLGLEDFQFNLGHLGLVRATLDSLELSEAARAGALAAIDRKDEAALLAALAGGGAQRAAAAALRRLVGLVGRADALKSARSLRSLPGARPALARLDALWGWIADAGLERRVVLDFGEVRGMDYYTGINFEIFAPGVGEPLGAGGRYDSLCSHFDLDLPAVGCAFTVEALMGWLERSGMRLPRRGEVRVGGRGTRAAALREAASVRARGGVAVLDFAGRVPAGVARARPAAGTRAVRPPGRR